MNMYLDLNWGIDEIYQINKFPSFLDATDADGSISFIPSKNFFTKKLGKYTD